MNYEHTIRSLSQPGDLFRQVPNRPNYIECYACGHNCKIREGKSGICKIRFNQNGQLMVPKGYVAALQVDPIEKKPFYHAYPNSHALSFGMLGCDFKCSFCQNWDISQTIRDPEAGRNVKIISAEGIVQHGIKYGARAVVSTYNEPLITTEWAMDVFKIAKQQGLATGYVSNGNSTPEVLDYIRPHTDLYKIDLKAFNKQRYREMGGNLEKILTSIKNVYNRGFWLEIVTLLIPGFNNDTDEVRGMAEFIADLSNDIPWHITAYHQDYKMMEQENTKPHHLLEAAKIAKEVGLNYVYPGNVHGRVGEWENTTCPNCGYTLIERMGFRILSYNISDDGHCPECRKKIAGIWEVPKERKRLFHFLN